MAVVSFADLDQTFDVTTSSASVLYTGGTNPNRGTTNFSWLTAAGGHDVDLDGVGFTYSGTTPTGGTVTQFQLDLGDDSQNTPELRITGLSFALASLANITNASLVDSSEGNLIWRTVLAGDDTINFGNGAATAGRYVRFAADGRHVDSGLTLFGGDDTITGDIGGTATFADALGDFFQIGVGAVAYGGDDTMTISGSAEGGSRAYFEGDADSVFGILFGGDDILTTPTVRSVTQITGDAFTVGNVGLVVGGDDIITLGVTTRGSGDVETNSAGIFDGGNDTIFGGSGANIIWGDAHSVSSRSQGGNDIIYGNGGNDTIYGDFETASGPFAGGNDTLYGGANDDTIRGNDGNDFLRGDSGTDTLDGGTGFDTASWQFGTGSTITVASGTATDGEGSTDTFSNIEQFIGSGFYRDVFTAADGVQFFAGLGGNDYVVDNGTGGGDVFNGGDGFDTIAFYNRTAANVNLALNRAIVDGISNTILSFEEVYGSNTGGDSLTGNSGNNTFWGFGGNDTLNGGRGLDTLSGGLGNDTFEFDADDFTPGIWDVISDFHEVAGTDFDKLSFNGLTLQDLLMGEANGGVYVSSQTLGGTGGVFVAGLTIAGLQDQFIFL